MSVTIILEKIDFLNALYQIHLKKIIWKSKGSLAMKFLNVYIIYILNSLCSRNQQQTYLLFAKSIQETFVPALLTYVYVVFVHCL